MSLLSKSLDSSNQKPKKLMLTIEGNIGAGKTSVIKKLKNRFVQDNTVCVIEEPVDMWIETKVLQQMYNKEISALEFQLFALSSRFARIVEALINPSITLIIIERSIEADFKIFAKINLTSSQELNIYEASYLSMNKIITQQFSQIHIFMQCKISTILERIHKRGRQEEKNITKSYLEQLKEAQDEWANMLPASSKQIIDAELDAEKVYADLLQVILDNKVSII